MMRVTTKGVRKLEQLRILNRGIVKFVVKEMKDIYHGQKQGMLHDFNKAVQWLRAEDVKSLQGLAVVYEQYNLNT